MDVLWKEGDTPAREIARVLTDELGWNVNTNIYAYQALHEKGGDCTFRAGLYVPCIGFQVRCSRSRNCEIVNKIYDGSADKLFAALLGRKKLSEEQIKKLKQIVGDLE